MRKVILIAASICLLGITAARAEDQTKEDEPSIWMKQKLVYSQRILNGLATEDFDLIAENATAMKGLSRIEAFVRGKTEGYRTHLKTFEFATNELIRNSEQANLDGATLAFTQMTISCVNCHKVIRDN
ncbi:MAG TPA: hypothetical protein P5307_19570 [Pirellulaceae bacterium]|nr:hypothetical protein [Planctomycetales bacterium]HRX81282.1 hypothetical protein [Pirellulaceae bacterium]